VLSGGTGKKSRDELFRKLNAVSEEAPRVILATGKYIGEGFDDSRLDTLFLAMPISWRGTLQQYVGRLHRLHENKRVVQVYDYVDDLVPMLARMYDRRLRSYKAIGYVIEESKAPRRVSELKFAEIERTAIRAVSDYESSRGWQVESVENQMRGFDLISRKPGFSYPGSNGKHVTNSNRERRFIEVKGRAYRGPISLSANEYSAAQRLSRNYWLYVVFNCASSPEVLAIQDPARLNWKPLSKIEQYQVAASDIVKAKP
jgi:superfamily II DNA or RNA helicase